MEFNYLLEKHALSLDGGLCSIDFARMPSVLAQLAQELLQTEATGDRVRAERWFAKYNQMPETLAESLATTKDLPVDIAPIFSFKDDVR